jgi:ParB family chromosome partitioning protein
MHYKNHPFKLYTGKRLDDMVESIRAIGIIKTPLVRPVVGGNRDGSALGNNQNYYEILSGHNRIVAAEMAGFTGVYCRVFEGLTDNEAHLIVTESNLFQRSFLDLSHSERAAALATQYEAMKKQGKRNDLVGEIRRLMEYPDLLTAKNKSDNADMMTDGNKGQNADMIVNRNKRQNTDEGDDLGAKPTSGQIVPEPREGRDRDVLGEKYGLDGRTISRYIRINNLIDHFKDWLDNKELTMGAAYQLAFTSKDYQEVLWDYITERKLSINEKQAKKIRYYIEQKIIHEDILDKLYGIGEYANQDNKPKKPKPTVNLKYKRRQLEYYFPENVSDETISKTILEALDFYKQYYGKIRVVVGDGGNQHSSR